MLLWAEVVEVMNPGLIREINFHERIYWLNRGISDLITKMCLFIYMYYLRKECPKS